ncbi:hypothetical protein MMC27_003418 [Xylographa pallens]|nr:hypothetical protein [Xylographa pallens]
MELRNKSAPLHSKRKRGNRALVGLTGSKRLISLKLKTFDALSYENDSGFDASSIIHQHINAAITGERPSDFRISLGLRSTPVEVKDGWQRPLGPGNEEPLRTAGFSNDDNLAGEDGADKTPTKARLAAGDEPGELWYIKLANM